MTFRSVQILKEVILFVQRTRAIRVSCSSILEIETKQYSFHEHNAYEKIPDLLGVFEVRSFFGSGLMWVCLPFRILGMIWSVSRHC